MITSGRRLATACALLTCTAVLAGCASVVEGHGKAVIPSPPPPSSSSSPAGPTLSIPKQWRVVTDAPTGIRFRLPGTPRLQRQPSLASDGTPMQKRVYEVPLTADDNFSVSVGVISGTRRPVTFAGVDLHSIPNTLIKQFRAAGATDFRILGERRATVQGRRALDFRVSFTPLSGDVAKALWFIRVVNDGEALVMIQTIAFPPVGEDAAYEPRMRALHARLVAGVQLN